MTNKAHEKQASAGENTPEDAATQNSADSVAAMIGTKNLKIIIVTMPIVFLVVVGVIIAVFGKPGERENAAAPGAASNPVQSVGSAAGLNLPNGATIESMTLDGDRLAVHVDAQQGAMIVIYDLRQDIVVKTIPIAHPD